MIVFSCGCGHYERVFAIEPLLKREFARLGRSIELVLGAPLRVTPPNLERLILWAPVGLILGAALYFLLPLEPAKIVGQIAVITAITFLILAACARSRPAVVYLFFMVALAGAGFGLAQARTLSLIPPDTLPTERAVLVEGWIEAVERGGNRPRLRIRVESMQGALEPPHRIRVRAGLNGFDPGDSVKFRAVLNRLPGPAVPGGYDPARAAWFDRVALSGFAVSRLEASETPMDASFERSLARYRWSLAERIREKTGPDTGGVAAALLTGDRSGVNEADAEALRVSGLGHILAISGLHMALFAGGVYFAVRFALSSIDRFARAHDPRKLAAFIALLAATGYLVLSGAAIPTQRAWVMAAVVLAGVMLDRRAFSMRSLALAAIVVVCLAPESVVEVGFQMSFAAVAALIAVYEVWTKARPQEGRKTGLLAKGVDAFAGLATTSLVAGAATGAFAAFHFQRMAAYGLMANLIAMPIFTFWVMPAGVIALGLSPFGLEGVPLAFMDVGLKLVLGIAHWTAGLDGAGVSVLAASGAVIFIYAAGFTALTIGLGLVRLAGAVVCLLGLSLWAFQSPADLMVTEDGVLIAQFETEGVFQATSLRSSRFESRIFMQRAGQGAVPLSTARLHCDAIGCIGETRDGVLIALTENREGLEEDCRLADVVIYAGDLSPWQRRRCSALLLDAEALADHGGLEIRVHRDRLSVDGTAEQHRRSRIWSQAHRSGG